MKETFVCTRCGIDTQLKLEKDTVGTGYALMDNKVVCYDCCGTIDKEWMIKEGKITLYLSGGIGGSVGKREVSASKYPASVGNWPGTLKFKVKHIRLGYHNIARYQYTVYFNGPDGFEWVGKQYGDNTQICHCRRTKIKSS